MPSLLASSFLVLLAVVSKIASGSLVAESFKIDVHSHVVPDFYREALIEAGYPVKLLDGQETLFTDGFPVSEWNLTEHIAAMDSMGANYSTLSVSAPGVNFLAGQDGGLAAAALATKLNLAMYNYTQAYPTRLGAMCILPLPDINATLAEITFCLDVLNFDGVGMYTNANGTYLGDSALDPVFALLNARSATVFVHPAAPYCAGAAIGYPDPMTEYPFESVRAMENMLLTGQRANYSQINMIFPHGGGVMPYLATRIAGLASLSFLGSLNVTATLAQFRGYLFDTASATTVVQLLAMKEFFGGTGNIVTGTDYPYVPLAQGKPGLAAIQANGNFSSSEMAQINNQNALNIFPGVAKKLGFAI
ncbi:Decarboxylase yanB [Lachnellula arida]|uniref:Decarboxylase yanB n=1 Tax=Lachnellula arida TaxID=1316785 RepID=A0A8T9B901_9HELO|nr:Decarboxylase yanB [Lachnellula arida]